MNKLNKYLQFRIIACYEITVHIIIRTLGTPNELITTHEKNL